MYRLQVFDYLIPSRYRISDVNREVTRKLLPTNMTVVSYCVFKTQKIGWKLILKGKAVPLQAEMPRGFQEVKVPRLRDNGPEWW